MLHMANNTNKHQTEQQEEGDSMAQSGQRHSQVNRKANVATVRTNNRVLVL